MKFEINRRTFVLIACWIAIILIAPFALEVVFLAEIVGAEATLGFLFLYIKYISSMMWERLKLAIHIMKSTWRAVPSSPFYNHKVYTLGFVASFVLFWLTGSLLIAMVAWTPSVITFIQQV
ncbi:MAG: hypothetical protein AAF512_04780 [Pseudomonadota bacterium]